MGIITRRRKAPKRRRKMKAALFLLSALVASSQAVPKSRNELTCSICIDIITDLDNFITSDTTEDQISIMSSIERSFFYSFFLQQHLAKLLQHLVFRQAFFVLAKHPETLKLQCSSSRSSCSLLRF